MTQSKSSEHYKQVQQEKTFEVDSTQGGDAGVPGRTAYQEEYRRDYGPDRDQSSDGNGFGSEF